MQVDEQYQEDSHSITHSPYYGCTVRVVSKANVSYEGILDGISTNKDRIFLKNVRVKGNINDSSNRVNSFEELDTLNTVMIDHLTNDMHIYEQVCLNIRDIQELKLIRLPATFHESKAKLRAIDPCLVDIRLSPSDEHERKSDDSPPPPPIARRSRGESLGSNGGSALLSSSSNESSLSFDHQSNGSIDEQINKLNRLTMNNNLPVKPATLLAKKILPKKIERNNHYDSNQTNTQQKKPTIDLRRKASPIRVTITSKLNPDATPFYAQQRSSIPNQNSSFTFYERTCFQPRLQPVNSPDRSQSHMQQPNHQRSHQRFVPPRQMAIKKNFNNQSSSSSSTTSSYSQQHSKSKISSHEQIPGLMHQTSSTVMNQILSTPPFRERLSVPANKRPRQSPANLCSTASLPYQNRHSGDFNHFHIGDAMGSHRGQRTISGTSSGSSLSVDFGPHSIVQIDATSNALTSDDGQYDFEKANQEFRRYLELEELVIRRASSACSVQSGPEDNPNAQQPQTHSYKKEISFFDRISCTATTGTAVGYTEQDEDEKNLETFGDDALLINVTDSNENEWRI